MVLLLHFHLAGVTTTAATAVLRIGILHAFFHRARITFATTRVHRTAGFVLLLLLASTRSLSQADNKDSEQKGKQHHQKSAFSGFHYDFPFKEMDKMLAEKHTNTVKTDHSNPSLHTPISKSGKHNSGGGLERDSETELEPNALP